MAAVFSMSSDVLPLHLQEACDYVNMFVAGSQIQAASRHTTAAAAAALQSKRSSARMYKSNAPSIPHTLQRVLDAVAAHQSSQDSDVAQTSSTDGCGSQNVRQMLQSAYGTVEGSQLHRRWVARPRQRIDSVVEALSRAVVQHYQQHKREMHCTSTGCHYDKNGVGCANASSTTTEGSAGDMAASWATGSLDVHVQLLPSPATQSAYSAFCACVIVRRKDTLAQLAQSQRALERCFTAVAAPGQTLASALAFWEGVSYESAPLSRRGRLGGMHDGGARVGEEEPLGLTRLRSPRARMAAEYEKGRRAVLMRHFRESAVKQHAGYRGDAHNSEGGSLQACVQDEDENDVESFVHRGGVYGDEDECQNDPVILGEDATHTYRVCRGTSEITSVCRDEASGRPMYCPPGTQAPSHATCGVGHGPGGGNGSGSAAKGVMARQSFCGLEYVVYVSLDAMGYVAYPQPLQQQTMMPDEVMQEENVVSAVHTKEAASMPAVQTMDHVRWHGLTMEASTSFTRGLIGLS